MLLQDFLVPLLCCEIHIGGLQEAVLFCDSKISSWLPPDPSDGHAELQGNLASTCVCAKSLRSHPAFCNPMDCRPSMGFSWQEYWSGLPCLPPGDLPNPGTKPAALCLLHWQAGSLPLALPAKPTWKP